MIRYHFFRSKSMKKISCLLTMLVVCSSIFAMDVSLGVKGDIGMNTFTQEVNVKGSGISVTTDLDTNFIFSGRIGVVAGFQINDLFAIEPEVMFNLRNGAKFDMSEDDYKVESIMTYKTLELPVMFKAKFNVGNGKLAVGIGPQFNFLIGDIHEKTTVTYDGESETETDTFSAEDNCMKTFSMGLAIGAEYGIELGAGTLVVGGRLAFDLTNVLDEDAMKKDYENLEGITVEATMKQIQFFPSIAYMIKL